VDNAAGRVVYALHLSISARNFSAAYFDDGESRLTNALPHEMAANASFPESPKIGLPSKPLRFL